MSVTYKGFLMRLPTILAFYTSGLQPYLPLLAGKLKSCLRNKILFSTHSLRLRLSMPGWLILTTASCLSGFATTRRHESSRDPMAESSQLKIRQLLWMRAAFPFPRVLLRPTVFL